MIFNFLPGIDKHFICNISCSSDDSGTQLIHILHSFTSVFYKPLEEKTQESNLENQGARE